MQRLGTIERLQVQTSGLKLGERGHRIYDPAPLQAVPEIQVEPGGVRTAEVVDVHHADHPHTKNVDGVNGVSLGFTSHYQAMRERYGDHLADGIAGESILIRCDRTVILEDLEGGVVVRGSDGREVVLRGIEIAEPCLEFTRFAMNREATGREVADELGHLRWGLRGFYARYEGEPVAVRVGDEVYLP